MKILFVPNNAGFFSNFNKIITHIWIYKQRGIECEFYVKWFDYKHFLYCGDKLWPTLFTSLIPKENDTYDIIIENYFHQEELKFIANNTHQILINEKDQSWRYELNQIYKEHINLHSIIQNELDQYYENYMKGYHIISVHLRSSAHGWEQYNKQMPSREIYKKQINEYIATLDKPYKIYLATDIVEGLDDFKLEYGDKLIYLEHQLYKDGEDHGYVLGSSLEKGVSAMKDALLLSRGDILFHSISNIPFAVLYINPDIKNRYIYI